MGVFMLAVAVLCCSAFLLATLTWLANTDGVFTANILVTSTVIFFLTSPTIYEAWQQADIVAAFSQARNRSVNAIAVFSGLFAAVTFVQLLARDPLGKLLDRSRGGDRTAI